MLFRILLCVPLLWITAVGNPSMLQAQTLEDINRVGPKFYTPEVIESVVSGIEWQNRVIQKQIRLITEMESQWKARYEAMANARNELQVQMRNLGVSFEDSVKRKDAIAQIRDQLAHAEIRIRSLDTTIAELQLDISSAKQAAKTTTRQAELSIKTAEANYEMAKSQLVQLEALKKKGFVPNKELQRAEYSAQIAKLELENAKVNLDLARNEKIAELELQLAKAQNERTKAEVNLKRVQDCSTKVESLNADPHMIQFEQKMSLENLGNCQRKIAELNIESTRNSAIQDLLREHLKKEPSKEKE